MKYIITENQNKKLSILRRLNQDEALITEIVREGIDMDDPCDFKTLEKYKHRIFSDSARTYLFHYLDVENDEIYNSLLKFMLLYLEKNYYIDVVANWEDKKEDCENYYDEIYNN